MNFDLKKSDIYRAVISDKLFPGPLLKFYRLTAFTIAFIALAGWIVTSIVERSLYLQNDAYQGIFYIAISLALSVLFFELFDYSHLRFPRVENSQNLADWLSFTSARALVRAKSISEILGENEVSPRSVSVALLKDRSLGEALIRIPQLVRILSDFQRQSGHLKKSLLVLGGKPFSGKTRNLLEASYDFMQKRGSNKISPLDILVLLFDFDEDFRRTIQEADLSKEDLAELAYWYEHIWSYRQKVRKFWSLENLYRRSPIGKDWIFGYLRYLNIFGLNLTLKFKYLAPSFKLASRTREIERMEEILVRAGENNIILVGPESVGKERAIEDFAEMVAHGRALPALNYKNIFQLNLDMILSSAKSQIGVENILVGSFNEAAIAGNAIVVINDIHNYVGELQGLGRMNIIELLIPYLKSSRIQIIATTDTQSYHRFIESRSDLSSVFERIDINEPDKIQTLRLLEERVPEIEHRFNVIITYSALKSVVENADKFITTAPFPEKAFDLVSEVVAHVVSGNLGKLISPARIDEVVSRKTGVPLGPVVGDEKEKLANFEKLMRQELVGQERAIEVVSTTLRRLRSGLARPGRPAGVFLFVGPTGVGKTLTAKILAHTYFGSDKKMIRFDMSEFQNFDAVDRFLGNLNTNEPGQFVSLVRDNPFSLILLDELEKANKNLLNLFLQVFDEGHLTDVFGRKVSFEQNIIIATSNAGAASIRDLVNHGVDPAEMKDVIMDILIKEGHFLPEFLNRFDEIVIFHPLSYDQIKDIAGILLGQLAKRLAEKGYVYEPTKDVIEYIAKEGFDPQFGARPMERVVRDKIENLIAKKILDNEIQKGVSFSVASEDLK